MKNVTVMAADPIWQVPQRGYIDNISRQVATWQHQINANGGFATATFTCTGNISWMDEWFMNGLGRDISVKDAQLKTVWEGFVNRIVYNLAEQAMVWGPLMPTTNRLKLIFTPYINISVSPPTTGTAQETTYVEDEASQLLWGIREAVISTGNLIIPSTVGGGGADEATQVRNSYLDYLSNPEKSQEIQYGGDVTPSIVFECLGYVSMLDAFTHLDNNAGYQTFTEKIKAVLAMDPNHVFSNNQAMIEDNNMIISRKDRNRTGTTVIAEIAAQGDVNYARWIYGCLANREFYYKPAPTIYDYIYRRGKLYNASDNTLVQPWQAQSGKWIYYADMVYKSSNTPGPSAAVDPQSALYGFIESANFTSPYSVQLSGRRITTIGQLLAQKGLSV